MIAAMLALPASSENSPYLVKDIGLAPTTDHSPTQLLDVNGTVLFRADDGVNGPELWKSNGEPDGTMLVRDVMLGVNSSGPSSLTNVNGILFFQASDREHGQELWKSDGTAAGTMLVKDQTRYRRIGYPEPHQCQRDPLFLCERRGIL